MWAIGADGKWYVWYCGSQLFSLRVSPISLRPVRSRSSGLILMNRVLFIAGSLTEVRAVEVYQRHKMKYS